MLSVILLLALTSTLAASKAATIEDNLTEYYTAFLNISYFDKERGVFHTEKTETGRFSTNAPKDFKGVVVTLISNFTNVGNKTDETIGEYIIVLTT